MSKKYKIKWRESDLDELQRVINNFNAKLYRIQRKSPDASEYLPQKLNKKAVIGKIETRADYNRLMSSYKRFSKRGSETPIKSKRGAKATVWEKEEFKRNQRAENRKRKKLEQELGQKPVTVGGKDTGMKRAEMGGVKENAVIPDTSKFENMSQREWELKSKLMEKRMFDSYGREKKLLWQRNYIKGLMRVGMHDDVIEMVQHIDPDKFAEIIDLDEAATIDFIYDPQELQVRADYIREVWSQYAQPENITNFDLDKIRQEIITESAQGYIGRGMDKKWYKPYYKMHKKGGK